MEDGYSDLTQRQRRQAVMAEAEGGEEGLPLIHGLYFFKKKNNAKMKDLFSCQDPVTRIIGFNHTETVKESIKAPGAVKCR